MDHSSSRVWPSLCVLFVLLVNVTAQTISPSNSSSSFRDDIPLILSWRAGTPEGQPILYTPVQPLTTEAGLNKQPESIRVEGRLVIVNAPNPNITAGADIAYVSCDTATWPGVRMDGSSVYKMTAAQDPVAIVLYSLTSDYCNYTPAIAASPSNVIYTVVGAENSTKLADGLSANTAEPGSAVIAQEFTMPVLNSTSNNSTARNDSPTVLGPSPTTAVAMIILYTITGVITGLFLMIIIIGAVRAHRHPERYGPRQGIYGRTRQSRAKGIARAVLETLPIVKFGEKEEPKPGTGRSDVEMGPAAGDSTSSRPTDSSAPAEPEGRPSGGNEVSEQNDHIGVATPRVPSSSDQPSSSKEVPEKAPLEDHPDATQPKDDGLGCSICTEDFVKGEDVRVLPCDHKYHPACIDPWLLNVSGTCPLCRVDLRPRLESTSHDAEPMTTSNFLSYGITSEGPLPPPLLPDPAAATIPTPAEGDAPQTRRQRGGISMYLEHHLGLNIQSQPEERIAALRRLRNENRRRERDEGSDGDNLNVSDRRRSRLSGIFAGRASRRASRVSPDRERAEQDATGRNEDQPATEATPTR
ncbi:MAG: hypothetical protein M1817_002919 [Caeruleum heppii]|nr:MAG: hypothetical protein M1817_002919 [Caeruleum heppii]